MRQFLCFCWNVVSRKRPAARKADWRRLRPGLLGSYISWLVPATPGAWPVRMQPTTAWRHMLLAEWWLQSFAVLPVGWLPWGFGFTDWECMSIKSPIVTRRLERERGQMLTIHSIVHCKRVIHEHDYTNHITGGSSSKRERCSQLVVSHLDSLSF